MMRSSTPQGKRAASYQPRAAGKFSRQSQGTGASRSKSVTAASRRANSLLTPGMTCETAFRTIARRCVDNLSVNQDATMRGNREALHKMRVALTRFRTAVSFFSPMVLDPEWTRLKGELKWLKDYLSAARDLDVAMETFRTKKGNRVHPKSDIRAWEKRWSVSRRRLVRALRSRRYHLLIKATSKWIENGPWSVRADKLSKERRTAPIVQFSARGLSRWYKKQSKKSRELKDMDSHRRHRLRISSKKLRYAIEFAGNLFPKKHSSRRRDMLAHVRTAQKLLGDLNDAEIGHSLAASLERSPSELSSGENRSKQFALSKRRKKRLVQAAKLAYQKMARMQPFWE